MYTTGSKLSSYSNIRQVFIHLHFVHLLSERCALWVSLLPSQILLNNNNNKNKRRMQ